MMVGLEIRDGNVLAVAVDAAGTVTAREATTAAGADVAGAATAAVERVTPGVERTVLAWHRDGGGRRAKPVACDRSAGVALCGALQQRAMLGLGTAAAVAEAWIGAAKGVRDVVYLRRRRSHSSRHHPRRDSR